MSSRSKKILSLVPKKPDMSGNETLASPNNQQNVEVVTEDGYLLTDLNDSVEDNFQKIKEVRANYYNMEILEPQVFTSLISVPLENNLRILSQEQPTQSTSTMDQGENANETGYRFTEVDMPCRIINNQIILNEPEQTKENESIGIYVI
ncbi:unnamed protein product [Psylliodes chrysocephalus]|uniref:Uncharacterized protein n=1 Tax=Psylliodes chrysocephalus TaxID=3402493 RepID=A0A9P0CMG8_9CUCU|nr:unnamed protein product [Psylliodes chrysocephala]